MSTSIERTLELAAQVAATAERVAEIRARAATEGRDLSRRERVELEAIVQDGKTLAAKMPKRPSGQSLQGGTRVGSMGEEPNSHVLEPGASVREWVEDRGIATGELEDGAPSLGRTVRGLISGDWRGAEAEHRALGEGASPDAGALLAPELAGSIIDRLAPATRVIQAGARIVPVNTFQMYVGRMTGPGDDARQSHRAQRSRLHVARLCARQPRQRDRCQRRAQARGRCEGRAMSARALSIRQPWAWAIVAGHKDVENRVWSTRHRGPLLIHAAQQIDREGLELMAERGIEVPELARGALVGRVRLVDVVTDSRSSWALPGLYHFLLEDPKPIRPVRCRGRLRMFIPDVRAKGV